MTFIGYKVVCTHCLHEHEIIPSGYAWLDAKMRYCWTPSKYFCDLVVRLKLNNHFIGFIPCQFACNLAFKNPVFRYESCQGSVCERV